MNEVLSCIKSRRSIRSFTTREVSKTDIQCLIESAVWAPSGKNGQPWKFSVLLSSEIRDEIANCSIYRRWLNTAPCLIAVFLDTGKSYDLEKDIMAIGASIQNMLLTAHELGLGTCWIGDLVKNEARVKEIIGADEPLKLMAIIAVGYKDKVPLEGNRKDPSDSIISWL